MLRYLLNMQLQGFLVRDYHYWFYYILHFPSEWKHSLSLCSVWSEGALALYLLSYPRIPINILILKYYKLCFLKAEWLLHWFVKGSLEIDLSKIRRLAPFTYILYYILKKGKIRKCFKKSIQIVWLWGGKKAIKPELFLISVLCFWNNHKEETRWLVTLWWMEEVWR